MALNEYAGRIAAWVHLHFPDETIERRALVLAEETGEVMRCILKMQTGTRGTAAEWHGHLYEEIGDVFIALQALALFNGIDLDQAVRDRWSVIAHRDPRAVRELHS